MAGYILTAASSGRDQRGINFKGRARNGRAAEAGVSRAYDRKFGGEFGQEIAAKIKVLW